MKIAQIKQRLARNILALDSLTAGNPQPALDAIQMGKLSEDQLRHGLTERIKTDYRYLTATRRNVAAVLTASAGLILGGSQIAPSAKTALTEFVS